ncbi:MAG: cation diffusion facilitator family transporter [Desulfurococcales archaeon]|jgi:cation diffusion facilitator family transporter|nr:cation diffusion facilitator family transporter [Desulfurococcales archaeon]
MVGSRKSPLIFLFSVALNSIQAGLKLVAFILTGSLAVYAETLHSLSDSINSLVLYMGALLVNRKPTPKYPFGFARFPYIASIISISILVGAIANNIFIQAYEALQGDTRVYGEILGGSSLIGVAVAIDIAILTAVYRAKHMWRNRMSKLRPIVMALIIEDLFSLSGNLTALSSLILSATYPYIDALGSMAIASIILAASAYVIYKNIEVLVGRSAPKDVMLRVLNTLSRFSEVVDIDDLKSYAITPDHIYIVATLGVDPRKSVKDLDGLRERIVREIMTIDPRIKRVIVEFSGEPIDDRDRDRIYREISYMEE